MSSTCGSTRDGSPTNPRSRIFSMLESGSLFTRVSLRAPIKAPSLPDSPTALPPAAVIAATMPLLMRPDNTISTISTVAASVTRNPSTNSVSIDSRLSIEPICGPPPCTTMGFSPTCFNSTISRAKASDSPVSPIAWPPYLTTITLPAC